MTPDKAKKFQAKAGQAILTPEEQKLTLGIQSLRQIGELETLF
jgi:hypothetical protein